MEDQSKYSRRDELKGKTEIFRIYYDPNLTSFDLFLFMEDFAITYAANKKWKLFKALPSESLGPLMVGKN